MQNGTLMISFGFEEIPADAVVVESPELPPTRLPAPAKRSAPEPFCPPHKSRRWDWDSSTGTIRPVHGSDPDVRSQGTVTKRFKEDAGKGNGEGEQAKEVPQAQDKEQQKRKIWGPDEGGWNEPANGRTHPGASRDAVRKRVEESQSRNSRLYSESPRSGATRSKSPVRRSRSRSPVDSRHHRCNDSSRYGHNRRDRFGGRRNDADRGRRESWAEEGKRNSGGTLRSGQSHCGKGATLPMNEPQSNPVPPRNASGPVVRVDGPVEDLLLPPKPSIAPAARGPVVKVFEAAQKLPPNWEPDRSIDASSNANKKESVGENEKGAGQSRNSEQSKERVPAGEKAESLKKNDGSDVGSVPVVVGLDPKLQSPPSPPQQPIVVPSIPSVSVPVSVPAPLPPQSVSTSPLERKVPVENRRLSSAETPAKVTVAATDTNIDPPVSKAELKPRPSPARPDAMEAAEVNDSRTVEIRPTNESRTYLFHLADTYRAPKISLSMMMPYQIVLRYRPRPPPRFNVVLDLDLTLEQAFVVLDQNLLPKLRADPRIKFFPYGDFTMALIVRPHVRQFLVSLGQFAELFVYTHGEKSYAEILLDRYIDPEKRLVRRDLLFAAGKGEKKRTRKCLELLFGPEMARAVRPRTVIIDDQPTVWEHYEQRITSCHPNSPA